MKEKTNPISWTDAEPGEILRLRAKLLAKETKAKADVTKFIKVVEFRLANETYGIELHHIRVIFPLKDLTYIPGAPAYITGIINMRGEIISIVDLKRLFDLPESPVDRHHQVLILSSGDMEFGIAADQVLGVKQIPENDIQASLPTLTGIRLQYLKGVTGDGLVLLDGEKILTDKNMRINIEDSE